MRTTAVSTRTSCQTISGTVRSDTSSVSPKSFIRRVIESACQFSRCGTSRFVIVSVLALSSCSSENKESRAYESTARGGVRRYSLQASISSREGWPGSADEGGLRRTLNSEEWDVVVGRLAEAKRRRLGESKCEVESAISAFVDTRHQHRDCLPRIVEGGCLANGVVIVKVSAGCGIVEEEILVLRVHDDGNVELLAYYLYAVE